MENLKLFEQSRNNILIFYANFNDELHDTLVLFDNLNKIIFKNQNKGKMMINSKFNKSVDNLPETIRTICFGHSFNQPVENLPLLLEWIEFGYSFNQRVDMLPNTIRYLVFGYFFNQKIDDLPTSIEFLKLGEKFYQNLNDLPRSVQKIELEFNSINQQIIKLPTDLNELKINMTRKSIVINNDFINNLNKYKSNK